MNLSDFDLAADAERGATVTLANPIDGKPLLRDDGTPVAISIKGAEGKTFRIAQMHSQGRSQFGNTTGAEVAAERIDEETCMVLADVTTGWHGIMVDGSAWDFTKEAAVALYRRFPWIRKQVDAAVFDVRRFRPEALPEAA